VAISRGMSGKMIPFPSIHFIAILVNQGCVFINEQFFTRLRSSRVVRASTANAKPQQSWVRSQPSSATVESEGRATDKTVLNKVHT
jgi:hypothetical protein